MSLGLGVMGLSLAGRTGPGNPASVLSLATDTANGPTAATGSVSTTIGNGSLYWVVLLTADSTPTAPQVKAGLKADGVTSAVKAGSQAVSGTGVQTLSPAPTMLPPATGQKIAFMHETAAGTQSAVVVADGFTTADVVKAFFTAGLTSVTNPMVASGSQAVAVGDAVAFMYAEQAGVVNAGTLSDNLGNTYTACNAGTFVSTAAGRGYYGVITVAGTLTSLSVATTASTNDAAVSGAIFNGPFSAVDAVPAARTDSASPFTGTASGTLAQASELAIGMMASTATGTLTATSPWTLAGTPSSTGLRRALIAYQEMTTTASFSPSFSSTAAENTVVQTLSFRRSV